MATSREAPPYAIAATAAAHAPVPEASVGPTPRSQIRMRTRSGARPSRARRWCLRKMRMHGQRGGERVQARGRDLAEHHALRIADAERDRFDVDAVHGNALQRDLLRLPHRRGERVRGARIVRAAAAASGPASVSTTISPGGAGVRQPGGQTAHAVAGDLGRAAVGVQQTHRDLTVGAARRSAGRRRRCRDAVRTPRARDRRVVAVRFVRASMSRKSLPSAWALISLHSRAGDAFRQNASRCQPNRRTSARGSALNVPTKNVLKASPFHPPWSRDFTGKRSSTMRTSRKSREQARNSPALYCAGPARPRARAGPSSASTARSATRPGCRPGTPPRRRASARGGTRDQRGRIARVLDDAVGVNTRSNVASANGRCSPSASRRSA